MTTPHPADRQRKGPARPRLAKFVEVVEAHDARAEVPKDGMAVSGD